MWVVAETTTKYNSDLEEIATIVLRYIRMLCMDNRREAILYLDHSLRGIDLDPQIFCDIDIPNTRIYTWIEPEFYRVRNGNSVNIKMIIESLENNRARTKIEFTINHNGLGATLNIALVKEDGQWEIDSLFAEIDQ